MLSGFWNRDRRKCSTVIASDLGEGVGPSVFIPETPLLAVGRSMFEYSGSAEESSRVTSPMEHSSASTAFALGPPSSDVEVSGTKDSTKWAPLVFRVVLSFGELWKDD